MSTVVLTVVIAFVMILIALAALGISWLFTGKLSLRPGACGRDPTKKRDDKSCGTDATCSLCDDKRGEAGDGISKE